MITRSVLDTEYLAFPVALTVGGTPINPTTDAVAFAFMPSPANADPATGDWHTASWTTTGNGGYLAQVLVGPASGGVVPAPAGAGLWNVWIKVTDNPQVPVWLAGTLKLV